MRARRSRGASSGEGLRPDEVTGGRENRTQVRACGGFRERARHGIVVTVARYDHERGASVRERGKASARMTSRLGSRDEHAVSFAYRSKHKSSRSL